MLARDEQNVILPVWKPESFSWNVQEVLTPRSHSIAQVLSWLSITEILGMLDIPKFSLFKFRVLCEEIRLSVMQDSKGLSTRGSL